MDIFLSNPAALTWLILMILFIMVEALTVGLLSIWFAVGSLVAMITALLFWPLWAQILTFAIVSIVVLIIAKRFFQKNLNQNFEKTNADRIIGATARTTVAIDNVSSVGQVEVLGQTWSARAADGAPVPVGALVKITGIEGVKVIVETIKEEN